MIVIIIYFLPQWNIIHSVAWYWTILDQYNSSDIPNTLLTEISTYLTVLENSYYEMNVNYNSLTDGSIKHSDGSIKRRSMDKKNPFVIKLP